MAITNLLRRTQPSAAALPDPSARDDAIRLLTDAGDRLLAARRELIDATRAFEEARPLVAKVVTEYTAAVRASGQDVDSGIPSWPTLTAGQAYLERGTRGENAYAYAIQRQVAAEKHWGEEKARYVRLERRVPNGGR